MADTPPAPCTGTPSKTDLSIQLTRIEQALQIAGLATPQPEPAAMMSTAPFCFDTLEFHAWLQWVFLPRMRQAVWETTTLPAACAIAPLAEYRFTEMPERPTKELLVLLAEFDELANQYFTISEEGTP